MIALIRVRVEGTSRESKLNDLWCKKKQYTHELVPQLVTSRLFVLLFDDAKSARPEARLAPTDVFSGPLLLNQFSVFVAKYLGRYLNGIAA
jgi:hypothetical protein